jgi:uncharacterized protein YbjT (DUF2867 family)
MAPRKILVTGATGQQGGAAIKALLAQPPSFEHTILALTRNASSAKAQALASKPNVELLQGDLDDSPAIFTKAGGKDSIWGVFLVTVPDMRSKDAVEKELSQGYALIDAAVENGVEHFVFTSVDRGGTGRSDENPTEIGHFISKHNVEKYLRDKTQEGKGGMTWTILRPVAFMDNLKPGFFAKMFAAMWLGMGEETKLQLVSVTDIGVFAAKALGGFDKEEYKNQAISLAGDELSQPEGNEVFWKVFGRAMPRTYVLVGSVLQYMITEVGVMFKWFKDEGYGADIQQCKRLNPEMQDLATWLKEESGYKP